ncbi:hypothetical protein BBJ29_006281 [Phytophthora kernoviae]|uniref:Uncharacterized protein n=1 Tax=Phytophthora kernoviae TaxID=325452 RepID=A0A3F2RND5_9STRA|nr:hypothetical protein BBJ29_006281 [Phytophthora kernoviae]RLN61113.1 hypothetical protein BBP00_00005620 [Phytophthora kernoviae]
MWNQALRRVVHAEERHQEERRRQQLLQAAFTASSASNGTATTSEDPVEASVSTAEGNESTVQPATVSNGEKAPQTTTEAQYIDEDDEDYLQKHLLSSPTSAWSLLEDTQQANCLALNASNTLLAVGERDGRVTIWDNTTIRVITRELDPTLIALPAVVESHPGEDKTAGQSDKAASVAKTKSSTDAGDGDGSVENDDASAQDEDEVRTEDNASTADDAATATEEENDHESEETKTEDELDTSGGGVILTLSDLRVVKTSLKVVSQSTLVSAFRFDGAINTMSAHPSDPKVLIVNYNNSRPVLLDVRSGDRTELVNVPLENTQFTQPAVLSNSRYAALVCCARYGRSGTRIYCVTSKSTMAVLDATTFKCIDSAELTVLVQFVDLSVNLNETALLITSSKGIHEFLLSDNANVESSEEASNKNSTTVSDEHTVRLREVAVHSTGASSPANTTNEKRYLPRAGSMNCGTCQPSRLRTTIGGICIYSKGPPTTKTSTLDLAKAFSSR